jgi:hypothetical protein
MEVMQQGRTAAQKRRQERIKDASPSPETKEGRASLRGPAEK